MQEVEEISSQPSNTRWYHCPIIKFRRGYHLVIRLYLASGGDTIRISILYGNWGWFPTLSKPTNYINQWRRTMTRWERRWYSVFELRRNRQASPLPHTFAFDNWRLAIVCVFPCCEYSRTIYPVSPPHRNPQSLLYKTTPHTSLYKHFNTFRRWKLLRFA